MLRAAQLAAVSMVVCACRSGDPGGSGAPATANATSAPLLQPTPQSPTANVAPERPTQPDRQAPIDEPMEHVRAIATTTWRLYALRDDATLTSWDMRGSRQPETEKLARARVVVAVDDIVCALTIARRVSCKMELAWSLASQNDPTVPDAEWVDVGVSNVVELGGSEVRWVKSDGESHRGPMWFAVLGDGSVSVFELDSLRALLARSDPANTDETPAVTVRPLPGVTKARSIAVGHDHACAVLEGGGVVCWHQLLAVSGSDDRGPRPTTVEKLAIRDAVGTDGACIRRNSGPLTCLVDEASWGEALARGRRAQLQPRPGIARIRATRAKSCMIHDDGRAECTEGWSLPTTDLADVALGLKHACALTKGGKLTCVHE